MPKVISIADASEALVSYIQSGNLSFFIGSGASYPAIELAGDIEAKINIELKKGNLTAANLLALSFVEELARQCQKLVDANEQGDVSETLSNYIDFLSAIDRLLFERKNHLLPRQANVFTTNYDIFLEEAASRLPSLVLNDGFDRTSPKSFSFRFAPEQFFDRIYRSGLVYSRQAELPTINLVKLHGSLTWRQVKTGIVSTILASTALSAEDREDPQLVIAALKKRAVILPNLLKFDSTVLDRTYYDLLRIFANTIEKENSVLLVFGFSFSDEHIRDIALRSMRNPTSQLILFAYNDAASEEYQELFAAQRNVLIVAPLAEEVISFNSFNAAIESVCQSAGSSK